MFYVGLDVSVARTAVCIMDAAGQVILERSVESTPETITATIRASGKEVERVGLEAGINSAWIARGLGEAKLPVVVIDATHAAAALKTGFRNKTDKNDARGIADLMRVNKFRAVSVKSVAAQRDRALLTVREQLRRQSLDARNIIWSILQVEGLKPPKLASPAFQVLLTQSLDDEALAPLLRPLADVVEHIDSRVAGLDKEIAARASERQHEQPGDTARLGRLPDRLHRLSRPLSAPSGPQRGCSKEQQRAVAQAGKILSRCLKIPDCPLASVQCLSMTEMRDWLHDNPDGQMADCTKLDFGHLCGVAGCSDQGVDESGSRHFDQSGSVCGGVETRPGPQFAANESQCVTEGGERLWIPGGGSRRHCLAESATRAPTA